MAATMLCCFLALLPASFAALSDVEELTGVPGFRWVKLHWRYPDLAPGTRPPIFAVNYCEDQKWGKHRCKRLLLDQREAKQMGGSDARYQEFEAVVKGLRMATNYTVEVSPVLPDPPTPGPPHPGSQLAIRTKGFSARATHCLANSSVVEVETGPNFGGKVSVEGSDDPRCWTEGERTSGEKTKYLLKINHEVCGSEVHNTSVITFIIVQENLPILTHSTRRFLVKCSYIPETFTVRAGVNLPDEGNSVDEGDFSPVDQSVLEVDPSELFDSGNTLFDSRLSGDVGRALRMSARESSKEPKMWAHLVLMVILVLAAVVGLSCAAWHFIRHARAQNRQGFMSPQEEPRALQQTSSMEAVVRDFGRAEAMPACADPPVALINFFAGADDPTDELYDLSHVFDLGYDPTDDSREDDDLEPDQPDYLHGDPMDDDPHFIIHVRDLGDDSMIPDDLQDDDYPHDNDDLHDYHHHHHPHETINPQLLDFNLTTLHHPPSSFTLAHDPSLTLPPHLAPPLSPLTLHPHLAPPLSPQHLLPSPRCDEPMSLSSDDDLSLGYSEDEVFDGDDERDGSVSSPLPHHRATPRHHDMALLRAMTTPLPYHPCNTPTTARPPTPTLLSHPAYDTPISLLHLSAPPLSHLAATSLPHLPVTPPQPFLSDTPMPPLAASSHIYLAVTPQPYLPAMPQPYHPATPQPCRPATPVPPSSATPRQRRYSLDTNWKLGDAEGQVFPAFTQ